MGDAEKEALIGRLYQEKKSLTEEIRLLAAKAREIGEKYSWLGQALRESPTTVVFDRQSFDPNIAPIHSPKYSLSGAGESDLRELTDSLREKTARLIVVTRDLG